MSFTSVLSFITVPPCALTFFVGRVDVVDQHVRHPERRRAGHRFFMIPPPVPSPTLTIV
jgi:hypothetical protein